MVSMHTRLQRSWLAEAVEYLDPTSCLEGEQGENVVDPPDVMPFDVLLMMKTNSKISV